MVLSGIMWILKTDVEGNDIPYEYGSYKNKTLFNRFLRWAKTGIFENILIEYRKSLGKRDRYSWTPCIVRSTHIMQPKKVAAWVLEM
jgi:transposase